MRAPRLVPPPGPLSDRTDDELMTLAQAGVREAFAVLVERHAERLVRACARFVGDSEAGAEIAQETWVAVWARRENYCAEGRFFVWLVTAARNLCRNHLRRHGVVRRHADASRVSADPSGPPSASQIDRLLVEERRRRVQHVLSRLPERMREALLLRFGEELPYDEMAEVLGVGESTLRSRVHHGLRILKEKMEKSS
jgi:RNA polymerase sigma-70 factor, ECF subfamily